MRYLLCVLLMCGALHAMAIDVPALTDPVMVTRYDTFTHGLRCLKCQHQSIAESDSEFSLDVKAWVAQALLDGRSDQEIKDMLQARFGDRIFLEPRWQINTYLLWFLPIIFFLSACAIWWSRVRK